MSWVHKRQAAAHAELSWAVVECRDRGTVFRKPATRFQCSCHFQKLGDKKPARTLFLCVPLWKCCACSKLKKSRTP